MFFVNGCDPNDGWPPEPAERTMRKKLRRISGAPSETPQPESQATFSIGELAELCSETDGIGVVSTALRAKLVRMWDEENRRRYAVPSEQESPK